MEASKRSYILETHGVRCFAPHAHFCMLDHSQAICQRQKGVDTLGQFIHDFIHKAGVQVNLLKMDFMLNAQNPASGMVHGQ